MLEKFLARRNGLMQMSALAQAALAEETINAAALTAHQDLAASLEDHLLRVGLAKNVQFHPFPAAPPELADGGIDIGDVA